MAATSPPTRPPVAAGFSLTPIPGPSRVSKTFGRRRHATPRWRPPRCSRGGKPAVKDVVEDGTPPEPKTETKNDSEGAELQQGAGILGWFRLDSVAADILSIAAPTVLALAADPITALVDTAFVGHIGSAELAAVGASVAVFNLVSKLFNVPLLTVTTSFVAEQQAVDADSNSARGRDEEKSSDQRKILPAVSTSLTLAAGIGLLEMVALIVGSGTLIDIIGFTYASSGRTFSYFEGIWCSTNHSGTCSSGCISWILGYEDTIVCCRCWQLIKCNTRCCTYFPTWSRSKRRCIGHGGL